MDDFFKSLTDVSSVLSVVGFVITLWIAYQTTKIRKENHIRTRIPQISAELGKEVEEFFAALGEYKEGAGYSGLHTILMKIQGKLINLKRKLQAEELKQVKAIIAMIEPRPLFSTNTPVHELPLTSLWAISSKLNLLVTMLKQSAKDMKVPV